jgi:parallel beta-helix repeat protein
MTGGSRRNRVLRNQFSGNGYVRPVASQDPNFGIGLLGVADNVIEDNIVTANVTGMRINATSTGNIIRGNTIAGNPPILVSNNAPENAPFAFDILNLSAAGANTFENNLCITSMNAPCPTSKFVADVIPTVASISFDSVSVRRGGLVMATLSGSNLTNGTYFDIRFRAPGASMDEVAWNWQQGPAASHTIPQGVALGDWVITGVRAHQDANDHSGPFVSVQGSFYLFSSPF